MSHARRPPSLLSTCLAVGLTVVEAQARADDAPVEAQDRALAESLFREGKALLDAGSFEEACPKLEASQRLDPGGGTLLNIAVCHEKLGRTASAWAEYREALANARRDARDDRATLALERIEALEPTLPRLRVVVLAKTAPAGLSVFVDGRELPRAAWGTAAALDPGEHVVTARVGQGAFRRSVSLVDGAPPTIVEIPELDAGPSDAAAIAPPPHRAPAPSAPPAASAPPESAGMHPRRVAGIVTVAVGVASSMVGTAAGVAAFVKLGESDDACVHGCTAEGVAKNDQAQAAATTSTVTLAIGQSALVAGIALWATAPGEGEPRPRASFVPWVVVGDGAVLGVAGRF